MKLSARPVSVVDTQVWVAGLLSERGAAAKVVHAFVERAFTLALSEAIFEEYERVLYSFAPRIGTEVTDEVLVQLLELALLVRPVPLPLVCRDVSDHKFVECAVAASADFLVTKNIRHFPAQHGCTRVVRIGEFLRCLGR